MSDFYVPLATETALFAAMAVSFNILIGFGQIFSIAQGAFVASGAYSLAIVSGTHHQPFYVGVIVAVGVGGVMALTVGLVSFRVSDDYLAITTFALQIVVTSILNNAHSISGGSSGLAGIPQAGLGSWTAVGSGSQLLVALGVLVIVLEVSRRIRHSPFGLASAAIGEDAEAALALGKSAPAIKLALFCASGATSALAGAFYAGYLGYIVPASFDIQLSILLLSIVIIGGAGSLFGPVVGTVFMISLPEILTRVGVTSSNVVYLRQILFSVLLIGVVVFLRRGLLGASEPTKGTLARIRRQTPTGTAPEATEPTGAAPGELVPQLNEGLRCEGVTKQYGGLKALDSVSIAIEPGVVTGIVGPNGAGKTTLFEVLAGAQRATGGEVWVGQSSLDGLSVQKRARMGVIRSFQDLRLFGGMSVFGNTMVAAQAHRRERMFIALFRRGASRRAMRDAGARAAIALRDCGVDDADWRTKGNALSYAEQKLLSLARIEAASPAVVLLDEPASGVGGDSLGMMSQVIRDLAQRGRAVCVIEHNTKLLQDIADHMIFMHVGAVLAEGPPAEIVRAPALASIYFGDLPAGHEAEEPGRVD